MSQENVEIVRRWYDSMPSLRDSDPEQEAAVLDEMFRDYLDEHYELHLPGPDAHLVAMRDGRMTSSRVYRDRTDALDAVGLHG